MPEGDSVFRLAARLRPALERQRLDRLELRGGRAAGLIVRDLEVLEIATHGKHMLTRFDTGDTLHTHLLMQGSWTVTGPGKVLPRRIMPDVRAVLATHAGRTAWAVDVPIIDLLRTADESTVIGHLGPDPLRTDWDEDEALRRLGRRPDRAIIVALLDQRNLAGIGNLWANELCFLRGLHPWRPVGTVDLAPLVRLAVRTLRYSATPPNAYQVTTGDTRPGRSHWVAGRAGRPCLRCGTTIRVRDEVRADPEQRRTWWCPRCQPESEVGNEGVSG